MDNKKTFALINEIVSKSVSTDWHNAKLEWVFKHYYETDEPTFCLCGHFPINRIMMYENKYNKQVVELGICCSEKLLSSDYDAEVVKAYVKLKKDISKSMGVHALKYCYEEHIITQSSYDFYSNTLTRRKLSDRQSKWRIDINRLFMQELSKKQNDNKMLNISPDNNDSTKNIL